MARSVRGMTRSPWNNATHACTDTGAREREIKWKTPARDSPYQQRTPLTWELREKGFDLAARTYKRAHISADI
eukprot:3262182-Rhodomonas_salina.1